MVRISFAINTHNLKWLCVYMTIYAQIEYIYVKEFAQGVYPQNVSQVVKHVFRTDALDLL